MAALLLAVTASLRAQQPAASPPVAPRLAGACDGRVVSAVEIVREEPSLIAESAPRWARPVLRVALNHALTKDVAIAPFLLVGAGAPCTEFRLAESERVLRTLPYLAGATVRPVDDSAGGVRVRVETVDEIPLVVSAGVTEGRLSALTYGNANLRGGGAYAAASWREGFAYRDGASLRFQRHHLLGRPIRVGAHVERAPLGRHVSVEATRPFYTAYQHLGWYAGVRDAGGYAPLRRDGAPTLSLPFDRVRGDAGAVVRYGNGSALLFAGPFLTHHRFRPRGDAVVIADTGLAFDADTVLDRRYRSTSSTRVAAVLGARWLSYRKVAGFDALLGTQDIARGAEATIAFGHSLAGTRRGEVAAGSLFAGAGGATEFVGLSVLVEGQQHGGEWVDVVASGRLASYAKPSPRRTRLLGLEYSGVWGASEPFQLALGDRRAGPRGYGRSREVGARRLVLRAEQRYVFDRVPRWLALGVAGFLDAGRIWAGDAPFGTTTGTNASLGAGVLASVPRQSRRLLRLDVAVPTFGDPNARYEVRFTMSRTARQFWREPGDVARLRAVLPPVGVFGWP